jgi:hypothetical protein
MKKEITSRVIRQDSDTRLKYNIVLAFKQEITKLTPDQIADAIWKSGVNSAYSELSKP